MYSSIRCPDIAAVASTNWADVHLMHCKSGGGVIAALPRSIIRPQSSQATPPALFVAEDPTIAQLVRVLVLLTVPVSSWHKISTLSLQFHQHDPPLNAGGSVCTFCAPGSYQSSTGLSAYMFRLDSLRQVDLVRRM
jgi:hypothetical protein